MPCAHCGPDVDQCCVNDVFPPAAFYVVLLIEDRKVERATNLDRNTMFDVLTRMILSKSGQLEQKHARR